MTDEGGELLKAVKQMKAGKKGLFTRPSSCWRYLRVSPSN